MATVFRWLLRLTFALMTLGVATFALAYYFAARSLPDYDATYRVAGINTQVEIVRDNANVPHIFGATDDDVFFALGYAHAQDRLWQMTMLRRTVQGRLSELYGERTVGIDSVVRRFDLYGTAVASVDAQDAQTTAALEAYAKGVNAWLTEVNKGALGRGAPEMWVFNHPVSPWQPADSIAILKLLALQLSSHLEEEVLRARTSLMIGPERVLDILPDDPGSGVAALPEYAALIDGAPRYAANTRLPFDPISPIKPRELAGASNAWAASTSRSATGSTLLANDPHMGLTAPTVWYLARLELSDGGVIGGTIPGIPLIMSGRSADLGWGITSSYLDDQDVFIEEVNPDNPDQYRTPTGWADFETRDSIIPVANGAAITLKLPPPSYARRGGEIIASQLRAVGIETEVSNVEWAQWLEEVFNGKDYGLTIVSHTEPMDIGIYANPDYYFQYGKPEFVAIMEELNATNDPAGRTALLAQAQTMISEDYVNGYLFELAIATVAKAELQGLWLNQPTAAVDLTGVSWSQ